MSKEVYCVREDSPVQVALAAMESRSFKWADTCDEGDTVMIGYNDEGGFDIDVALDDYRDNPNTFLIERLHGVIITLPNGYVLRSVLNFGMSYVTRILSVKFSVFNKERQKINVKLHSTYDNFDLQKAIDEAQAFILSGSESFYAYDKALVSSVKTLVGRIVQVDESGKITIPTGEE